MPPSFERSRREVPELLWRQTSGSTNSELIALASGAALPAFTTLVTGDQTAGRGRLDRTWIAPAGTSLAISVLVPVEALTPAAVAGGALGWLPLAAGAAMSRAVTTVLPADAVVGVKWPNDVQIGGLKVCGILSELVPASTPPASAPAVVIGAGLNVSMTAEQLPVPTATSLVLAGAGSGSGADAGPAELDDRVLAEYLRALTGLIGGFLADGGDADRSGLRETVVACCTTIGRAVRVELPGGAELHGTASGIDALGRLEVREASGLVRSVAAGDIIHLR